MQPWMETERVMHRWMTFQMSFSLEDKNSFDVERRGRRIYRWYQRLVSDDTFFDFIRYARCFSSVSNINSWETLYERELDNFNEFGDEGEIWFVPLTHSDHLYYHWSVPGSEKEFSVNWSIKFVSMWPTRKRQRFSILAQVCVGLLFLRLVHSYNLTRKRTRHSTITTSRLPKSDRDRLFREVNRIVASTGWSRHSVVCDGYDLSRHDVVAVAAGFLRCWHWQGNVRRDPSLLIWSTRGETSSVCRYCSSAHQKCTLSHLLQLDTSRTGGILWAE